MLENQIIKARLILSSYHPRKKKKKKVFFLTLGKNLATDLISIFKPLSCTTLKIIFMFIMKKNTCNLLVNLFLYTIPFLKMRSFYPLNCLTLKYQK